MPSRKDRRRSPRVAVAAFATLETTDLVDATDQIFGAVADVSRTGIAVHVAVEPRMGQRVRVRLGIGEQIHELDGVVTRVDRRHGCLYDVGLDWAGCEKEQLEFLDAFLVAVLGMGRST
jgi:hypothetical protein